MEYVFTKDELLCLIWGLCLSDHMGDVAEEIQEHLSTKLGIKDSEWSDLSDLLELMKSKDLIPKYQR